MHYLIDGHNVIAQMTGSSLEDANAERALVIALRRWTAAGRNRRVTVVFDGGLPGGVERQWSSAPIEVLFAPTGRPADDVLLNRIRRAVNPAEYTLVSSDRELVRAAAARRIAHRSAADFAAELARPRASAPPPDPRDVPPDPAEVAEWLALFGGEPEPRPPRPPLVKPPPDPARPRPRPAPPTAPRDPELLSEEEVAFWLSIFDQDPGESD